MASTGVYVFACGLTFALVAGLSASAATDSVPAAITVYRNPEFFKNESAPERGESEDLEKADEEEEDKEDVYSNNSEEFYDFDDEYRYPGEPAKPNPPPAPDFAAYYDEYRPESPRPAPVREEDAEVDDSEENELNEESQEASEEEEEEGESNREEPEFHPQTTKTPPRGDKYHVRLDEDLKPRTPPKVYDYSKEYYNPIFDAGLTSFPYPSSYEDLDYYGHAHGESEEEEEKSPARYTDRKKGTREYLRDHSDEEVVEESPRSGGARADSRHVFKAVSKFGLHAYKPVLYFPHKIKSKHRYLVKPKTVIKWRLAREVPDDSAYELSSDYDSEFEFV